MTKKLQKMKKNVTIFIVYIWSKTKNPSFFSLYSLLVIYFTKTYFKDIKIDYSRVLLLKLKVNCLKFLLVKTVLLCEKF